MGDDGIDEFDSFVKRHVYQLKSSIVPCHLWHTLFKKLKEQIYDAGDTFIMVKTEEGYMVMVNKDGGVLSENPLEIYLIDHAWTFEAKDAAILLSSVPGLLPRMTSLMNVSTDLPESEQVHSVCQKMWKFLRTYSQTISTTDPPMPLWYVMDEFGSAIRHSSTPNFRAVPFFYQTDALAFTLLFPVSNVACNEEVTIDYVEGVGTKDSLSREAFLVPWTKQSFVNENLVQSEPSNEYFLDGANREKLPETLVTIVMNPATTLRVYTEYQFVREYLQHPGFVLVDNEDEADILWLTRHFHDYRQLAESRPNTFINQFPCERVVTTKDLLSIVARRAEEHPTWLPATYNLVTEVPLFVSTFQRRELAGLDNHWICKPWNLARALDTLVTNNLDCILRLPFSGPKVAQKYAEDPVLYNRIDIGRVKFDVRYVVLLESVAPCKLYCYKEFFLRFANKPFDLTDLWDYEKHFTVMNYRDESLLHHVRCDEFREEFASQYPNENWDNIELAMMQALKEVFESASSEPPPRGIPPSPQSRALYAADFILTWNDGKVQPLLLEINFGPDCERACLYYPEFYDDIFGRLFKNELNPEKFIVV